MTTSWVFVGIVQTRGIYTLFKPKERKHILRLKPIPGRQHYLVSVIATNTNSHILIRLLPHRRVRRLDHNLWYDNSSPLDTRLTLAL